MEEITTKRDLEQLLHDKRVSKINRAYASYCLEPNEHNLNDLLGEVTTLACRKLRQQAKSIGDVGMEDDDDFAQKVAITVWNKLEEFGKSPDEFFPWVMKIIANHRLHLNRDLTIAASEHVSFTLQNEEGEEYDNPAIYKEYVGSNYRIPEGMRGDEELIFYMIVDGYKQNKIAELLEIPIRTLERKIQSIKVRFEEAKRA
jgi:hypothetical protein